MVTCAVFLRLNSLLKLAVLLLAVAVYSYLIHLAFLSLTHHDMLHRYTACAPSMLLFFLNRFFISCFSHLSIPPLLCRSHYVRRKGICILLMIMFIVAVFYNGRQVECPTILTAVWILGFSLSPWKLISNL